MELLKTGDVIVIPRLKDGMDEIPGCSPLPRARLPDRILLCEVEGNGLPAGPGRNDASRLCADRGR